MSRITDYPALALVDAADVLPVVDISDTTQSPAGTTKQATLAALLAGLTWKAPVQQVTTGPLPASTYASGPQTLTATANGALVVDGVTCAQGQRVLVSQQATAQDNGIYVVTLTGSAGAPWQLTRAADMATGAQITGATVLVEQGSTQAGSGWFVEGAGPDVIGTTAVFWTKFTVIISGVTPQPLGTAAPGTSGSAADNAHVHQMPLDGQLNSRVVLAAPVTSTSLTLADVTGLGLPVQPGTYECEWIVYYQQTAATADGIAHAVNGPATSLLVIDAERWTNTTAPSRIVDTAYNTSRVSIVTAVGTTYPLHIRVLATFTAAGTIIPRFANDAGPGTVVVQPGSWGVARRVA